MRKITSELAYAFTAVAVIGLGFIKVYLPAYPHETTVTALVALAGMYFGKRIAQKSKMFSNGLSSVNSEQGGG